MNTPLTTLVLAAALTTTVATSAHAQPGQAPLPPADAEVELKSPETATTLAIVGTLAPIAMVAVGAATDQEGLVTTGLLASSLTPSMGHWYAGEVITKGMATRGIGALIGFAGVLQVLASSCWSDSCTDNEAGETLGAAMMIGGGLTYLGGTIYDVATAGDAARAYNRDHGLRLSVAPTVLPAAGGALAMGMGVGGSF